MLALLLLSTSSLAANNPFMVGLQAGGVQIQSLTFTSLGAEVMVPVHARWMVFARGGIDATRREIPSDIRLPAEPEKQWNLVYPVHITAAYVTFIGPRTDIYVGAEAQVIPGFLRSEETNQTSGMATGFGARGGLIYGRGLLSARLDVGIGLLSGSDLSTVADDMADSGPYLAASIGPVFRLY